MGEKNKRTVSMMKALLVTALLPTVVAAVVIAAVGCVSMAGCMEEEIYHELYVAAEGLKEFYEWDFINMEDH